MRAFLVGDGGEEAIVGERLHPLRDTGGIEEIKGAHTALHLHFRTTNYPETSPDVQRLGNLRITALDSFPGARKLEVRAMHLEGQQLLFSLGVGSVRQIPVSGSSAERSCTFSR